MNKSGVRYRKEMPIEKAVEQAITECIREGILKDFLEKNRREAIRGEYLRI